MLKIARGLVELVILEIGLALLGGWASGESQSDLSDVDSEFDSDREFDGAYDYLDI